MKIDTLNLAISIMELTGAIILLAYLWRKIDWQQDREYERFRDSISSETSPKAPFLQSRKKVNPDSASTPHRSPLD